jgi:dCMP deaminase
MRPTRDAVLMDTAHLWAQRSTCDRAHVGAVFSRDGRILVTGYNGAPAGMSHCEHSCTCVWGEGTGGRPHNIRCPSVQPCTVAVHAEANGIAWAAREGVRLNGCELHTTVAPCHGCAKLLLNAGIVKVVYGQPHREMAGADLLVTAGVEVRCWGPAVTRA